jgi:hypothetical protein
MKIINLLLFIHLSTWTFSQNLIPNSGFVLLPKNWTEKGEKDNC